MTTPSKPSSSPFDRLGGDAGLRSIVEDFISRVRSDMMIGFFFRQIDIPQLIELECSFAAAHLGGPQAYVGRPLQKAHGSHPIMGGHFNRRLVILDKTLQDHQVPDDIRLSWIEHNEKLRAHITQDALGECNDH